MPSADNFEDIIFFGKYNYAIFANEDLVDAPNWPGVSVLCHNDEGLKIARIEQLLNLVDHITNNEGFTVLSAANGYPSPCDTMDEVSFVRIIDMEVNFVDLPPIPKEEDATVPSFVVVYNRSGIPRLITLANIQEIEGS